MKKLIAMALLAWMLLAGCTAEDGPAEESPAGGESSAAEPASEVSSGEGAAAPGVPEGEIFSSIGEIQYGGMYKMIGLDFGPFGPRYDDVIRVATTVLEHPVTGPEGEDLTGPAVDLWACACALYEGKEGAPAEEVFTAEALAGLPDAPTWPDGEGLEQLEYFTVEAVSPGRMELRGWFTWPHEGAILWSAPMTLVEEDGLWLLERFTYPAEVPRQTRADLDAAVLRRVLDLWPGITVRALHTSSLDQEGEGLRCSATLDLSTGETPPAGLTANALYQGWRFTAERRTEASPWQVRLEALPNPLTRDTTLPDWLPETAPEGYSMLRAASFDAFTDGRWAAFVESQPDLVWQRQMDCMLFCWEPELLPEGRGLGVLYNCQPEDQIPERLSGEELYLHADRLTRFWENVSAGEPDRILFCYTGSPLLLRMVEYRFDGETLSRRFDPSWWTGSYADNSFHPVDWLETDTAWMVLQDGDLAALFPKNGLVRYLPTGEDLRLLDPDGELVLTDPDYTTRSGLPCELYAFRSGGADQLEIAYADDGSAAFHPDRAHGNTYLFTIPAPADETEERE